MATSFKLHVYRSRVDDARVMLLAEVVITPIFEWVWMLDPKPLYAINVVPKEVTDGLRSKEVG